MEMDRGKAWALLEAHNSEDMHLKHALAVEATMRHFAVLAGEDPELGAWSGSCTTLTGRKLPTNTRKKAWTG